MFSRTQNISLSPIKQMELAASRIPDVVSLAQGIPSFDTPEVVKRATIKALERGLVAKYSLTPGVPELREAIEEKLAEEGMYYDFQKEIIITAGSIEAITATLLTIIDDKKDEIILFSPSYTSYQEAVKVTHGKPRFVALKENLGWQLDINDFKKAINKRTAAVLVCNPNNPTGTVFPKEILLQMAKLAEQNNFFIITDEVYKDFIYDSPAYLTEPRSARSSDSPPLDSRSVNSSLLSETKLNGTPRYSVRQASESLGGRLGGEVEYFSLAQVPKLRKKVIRIFSLSKAYAMTGWRLGFLHSDEENVREILKVHDSLVTCAPVISQYAALGALDFGQKDIDMFKEEYRRRRDIICSLLDEMPRFFSYQKPNSSYFIFPKILPPLNRNSWEFAMELLNEAHVAVVPGVAFGPSGESHVRISFGRTVRDIKEAFKRIKLYLNGIK